MPAPNWELNSGSQPGSHIFSTRLHKASWDPYSAITETKKVFSRKRASRGQVQSASASGLHVHPGCSCPITASHMAKPEAVAGG